MTSFTVSRDMIKRALTETVTSELTSLLAALAEIPERDARLRALAEGATGLSSDTKTLLNLFDKKESEHVSFVNEALALIPEFVGDTSRKRHDYSKDSLYFLVTSAKFDCGLKTKAADLLANAEIERHYLLEAHHPQWESHNSQQCSQMDIREMAVDRLCRNVQVNAGEINMSQMMKFLPEFPLGDNQAKQTAYLGYVEQHKATVLRHYTEGCSLSKK